MPLATMFIPSVVLCVRAISSGLHPIISDITFLVLRRFPVTYESAYIESGPARLYVTRKSVIAFMLTVGSRETDALLR